jgi:DinB superfamily
MPCTPSGARFVRLIPGGYAMEMPDPVTEFELYRQELLTALGDDDPVAVLRAGLEEVPRLVAGASDEQLQRAPAPGEWSAWQVLSHLADSDLMAGTRVRMIVTQDRPALVGYDQEAWTARFSGLDNDVHETLERWRALRRTNIKIFGSLSRAEWERVGLHTERGEESARLTVQLMAGHDRVHLAQFRRAAEGKP